MNLQESSLERDSFMISFLRFLEKLQCESSLERDSFMWRSLSKGGKEGNMVLGERVSLCSLHLFGQKPRLVP
jgi:hypothetical protein